MKKYLAAVVTVITATLLPMTGQAKGLCLTDADGMVFVKLEKVKKLKPGATAPLYGVAVLGASGIPITGVAVVAADGTVNYGFTGYSSALIGVDFTISVYGADASLAGLGNFILDDGLGSGPISVMAADCKDLPSF